MTTIKRYSNRKLYDTETKRYITLSDVITMLREGKDITVIDNQSGRDITNLTLTQTILELEKKTWGTFSKTYFKKSDINWKSCPGKNMVKHTIALFFISGYRCAN
ncbi:MAG: polyhydroxyalkanoate synthesis regulator DNA-binding domain-containing protein [Anaerolineales bacterium]|nr:polyhydroxyalkanoate synthesis regulator DNA-binding domain-containing protein [Anaerolineales bacterium]